MKEIGAKVTMEYGFYIYCLGIKRRYQHTQKFELEYESISLKPDMVLLKNFMSNKDHQVTLALIKSSITILTTYVHHMIYGKCETFQPSLSHHSHASSKCSWGRFNRILVWAFEI